MVAVVTEAAEVVTAAVGTVVAVEDMDLQVVMVLLVVVMEGAGTAVLLALGELSFCFAPWPIIDLHCRYRGGYRGRGRGYNPY